MASTGRVMNLLDTPIAIRPGTTALPTGQVSGEVVFENVSFGYYARQPILNNLSLKIPAGKTTAIVGSTGAGKSTLVKLLLRFYEVNAGQITLDGLDVQSLELQELRRAIG